MPEPDLTTRREEARRAMEGDERRQAREIRKQAIGKRRIDARLAMESPTHRAKREARERAEREVTGAAEAKVEAERARREAAARAIAETRAKEEARAAAGRTELAAHVQTARQATAEINTLKDKPTRLSAFRTLKTDLAEAVSRGGSMAGTIIQERERETNRTSTPARRSHALITIMLILISLGALATGGTLVYRQWLANSPTPIIGAIPSAIKPTFVPSDRQTTIETTNQTVPALLGKIREAVAASQTPGTIDEIIFSKDNASLTFRAWQTLLSLPFPDGLLRKTEPTFMFGLYRGETNNVPFILLKTKATDQSYTQLLLWEKNLPSVWDALIGKPPALPPATTTSTVSTTPTFRDQVIQNLDTRVLEGVGVTQPALYGLLDSNTIILTQTRAAFLEILSRLRAAR